SGWGNKKPSGPAGKRREGRVWVEGYRMTRPELISTRAERCMGPTLNNRSGGVKGWGRISSRFTGNSQGRGGPVRCGRARPGRPGSVRAAARPAAPRRGTGRCAPPRINGGQEGDVPTSLARGTRRWRGGSRAAY